MTEWLRGLPTSVRLAAMTSSTFLILMLFVGVVGYLQFSAGLRAPIDQSLVALAAAKAKAIEGGDVELDELLSTDLEIDSSSGITSSDLEGQILARDGTVLEATSGLQGRDGLVGGRRFVRVAAGVPVFGDAVIGGKTFRYAGVRVADGSGRVIAVTTPITSLAEAERALLAVFGPIALAGSVLAGLAGAWISRRALAPITQMAAEAEGVGAYDLSQRLPVPARRDEVRRLGSTLNRMLDRLEAAVQRERDFASEASHELRTPLAILRAEVELARAVVYEPVAREGLDSALEEIDRLTAVVEDLLLLARLDVGVALDRRQIVDLGALASTAALRFGTVAAKRKITVTATGSATVNADPQAIERVLANLFDNALRHTPPGGTVGAIVEPGPQGATVVVRDTGPGVDRQSLASLFDRYTRAASRPGSAGLGLSIVAAVAATHGGSVRARNRPEGGLEITVELASGGG